MNIGFSNIAWPKLIDRTVAELLRNENINRLEIAPTRSFLDIDNVTTAELIEEKLFWEEYDISIVAMQSLLFGKPELQLFGSTDSRKALFRHLVKLFKISSSLGSTKLVFGSPRNRVVPDGLDFSDAWEISIGFFKTAGNAAEDFGVQLCLEPNPIVYGCNFITNAVQGLRLVEDVDSSGFKLHLDTACMALSGDNAYESIIESREQLSHFHISSAGLGPLEDYFVDHHASSKALAEINFGGSASVEMRPNNEPNSLCSITNAVSLIQKYYLNNEDNELLT